MGSLVHDHGLKLKAIRHRLIEVLKNFFDSANAKAAAINRHIIFGQYVRQAANVVKMPVGYDKTLELIFYLVQIENKLKGFVITHGHLDHIGGLPHVLPKYNVPVYGSRFSIGRVEEIFENFNQPMPDGFKLKTVVMNETTHERLKLGQFFVELVRVTHSIPGSTAIVIDTPVGRI